MTVSIMAFTLLGSRLLPVLALLPQENRKALGALVVLYPSLSFANSEFTFSNNLRLNTSSGSEIVARRQAPATHWLDRTRSSQLTPCRRGVEAGPRQTQLRPAANRPSAPRCRRCGGAAAPHPAGGHVN